MARKKPSSVLKRSLAHAKPQQMKKAQTASPSAGPTKPRPRRAAPPSAPPAAQSPPKRLPAVLGTTALRPVHSQAAYAVQRLLAADLEGTGGTTLKSLTLGPRVEHKAATHAVTVETLRHLPLLELAFRGVAGFPGRGVALVAAGQRSPRGWVAEISRPEQTEPFPAPTPLAPCTLLVLAYEALWGQGLGRSAGRAEAAVRRWTPALRRALSGASAAVPPRAEDAAARRWRTARVNTLKLGVREALEALQREFGAWREPGFGDADDGENLSSSTGVHLDPYLPDVVRLPPGTDLHAHALVASGALVLQSWASCLPAHVLAPGRGWAVVDACAAPGNKSSHLAALLAGRGRLLACDRDPARAERLRQTLDRAGAAWEGVEARCVDFLTLDLDGEEIRGVDAVLLDPSCSGSGTADTRMEHLLPSARRAEGEGGDAADRVETLARFQEAALRHALRFPRARRVCYSTCSVHRRENEDVVAAVLREASDDGWRLEPALPRWERRGLPDTILEADKLLRTDPALDGTDGFFVALFVRDLS